MTYRPEQDLCTSVWLHAKIGITEDDIRRRDDIQVPSVGTSRYEVSGEVLRAPDTQYIIPNSRDLRDIREVLIKMLNSWQYPHRVTSLRNSETGAACVLTSTLTAGTRFPFQRERVRILFFSFPLDSLVFPKFPTYRHLMSIFIIMKRFWRATVEILK